MIRLALIVTTGSSANLLKGQLAHAASRGFEPHLVCSHSDEAASIAASEGVAFHPIEMLREMAPSSDFGAALRLARLLRAIRADVVNAGTPKAGMLGMAAAHLAGVPAKILTLRGIRSETMTGLPRRLVLAAETVSARLADRVVCISPSLKCRAVELGLCDESKMVVVGAGSSNGVDLRRFTRSARSEALGSEILRTRGIPDGAPVVAFVGRLAKDKGIGVLAQAWLHVRTRFPNAHLLVAGRDEATTQEERAHIDLLRSDPNVRVLGRVAEVEAVYSVAQLVVLPSRREGFGNVLLEANAMGIPAVASRIPGCVDAIADGLTGTMVERDDALGFALAIERYLGAPELRAAHGKSGRRRAEDSFGPEQIWEGLAQTYKRLLIEKRGDLG